MRKFKIFYAPTPQGIEKQINEFVEKEKCILINFDHIESKANMCIAGVIYEEA